MCLRNASLGDKGAFDQVYREVAGPVYGVALRVLRDPTLAEEVAQEALMEVWRGSSRFDPERGSALAWVLTIAHRRAVDRVRAEQAALERQGRALRESEPLLHEPDALEAVEGRMERARLRHCMSTLTELQRESVTLAYYKGYTYQQVADLLDTPVSTVKTRVRDGLSRLRDCVEAG